ncbi:hypothetical protein BV22DRAFT_937050 [Leucogyrophana mollusca]|uniref:Uncharacterized protein n=1 Tax=Leucogyrophana mollusca TaxID=85980 RepID=A0ACB8AX40_9AGAM|nr:hypothetical protein BV22DRAFT_937050 [Leucogyrophana mollusca]
MKCVHVPLCTQTINAETRRPSREDNTPGILTLPSEPIEGVIVTFASLGWVDCIVALSQTNRAFYNLIYKSPDHHLWREIFLTTFDDPRPALNHLSILSSADPKFDADAFGWARAYQERIQTETRMKRSTVTGSRSHNFRGEHSASRSLSFATHRDLDLNAPELLTTLKTLLSTIATSNPFPQTPISLTIVNMSSTPDISPMANAPPFPPLLLLLSSGYVPVLKCHNALWLQDLLTYGYPAELTRTLFARISVDVVNRPGFKPTLTPSSYWTGSEIGHLFHQLVCCTGFVPFPVSAASPSAPTAGVHDDLEQSFEREPIASSLLLPTEEEQFADARILARRRVYDMRYLSPKRHWGPFQPVLRASADSSADQAEPDGDDNDADQDEDDHWTPIIRLIHGREANDLLDLSPPIQPYELVPDYVWLASARIVVEANLKEMLVRAGGEDTVSLADIVPTLRQMHTLRAGGSPGYWNVWADRPKPGSPSTMEPEKGNLEEATQGWDWAGAAGIWRRCICWLDYRELLIHNLSAEKFLEQPELIEEACRIIPLAVRITGYSKAPIPPSSSTRPLPTIHLEGESIGSDRDPNDGRKMKGSISMISDGAIRWTMLSYVPGASEPEWSSEAIQIGGPGSACGMLGMWTGAQHERSDPLGPFWAWKVA